MAWPLHRRWRQDFPPLLAKLHGIITQKTKVTSIRYFLVDHTTSHRKSLLNNDINLHLGGTLLVSKLKNGMITRFFKILGLDEDLKNEYSCLDVTRCSLVEIQRLILKRQ
jgi:hypothetical protein